MSEDELKIQFSNYERTVWVVNSIEGHLLKYYGKELIHFDRFPRFPQEGGQPLTPDFAACFVGDFNLIGEVKRALGTSGFALAATHEQICRYDQALKFRKSEGSAHDHEVKSHDILIFANIEYARKEAKQLRGLIRETGRPKRPVIIFSVTFDNQQLKPRWILSCLTDFSDRFSDAGLPAEKQLSRRHQDDEESLIISTSEFAAIQATHAFCNDTPPPIYTAVMLWARVLPKLMPAEMRATWALEENLRGTIEFSVPVEALVAEKERRRLAVRKQHVMDALALLESAKLVTVQNNEVVIRYRRFRGSVQEGEKAEEYEEAVIDHTKHGLIREISRGLSRVSTRKTRSERPRSFPRDPHQRMLDL